MAVDEAILWAVSSGQAPPTLRLYAWNPPCLSLGYAQSISDVDLDRLEAIGWHVVRRPTGGRAILHTDELTYSVALPENHPLAAGNVVESYRRISTALMAALQNLGLSPRSERHDGQHGKNGPVCFETPSHYEITADGRKLIGSAQVRRKDGILQHGTLPLYGDVTRICDALVFPDAASREEAKEQVKGRAITLQEALGREVCWEQVAEAVVNGFADTFDIDFGPVPGQLFAEEREQADCFYAEMYATLAWTNKR